MSGMLPLRDTDPREVGGYRLLGRLGEGGQGVVFLAVGPTGTQAAVKLLPPTTDPQVRSRFLKEVAAAQRVARFCTAQVLDAGIFERRPFIVSEYVSGPSLVEVVEQFGPRSGAALERIAVATLTALGAVHAVGMVHRDFKPGNVLLGPDGPVVIDFGLAAVPGMTTTGLSGQVAVGTPAFMAPEQLAAERVTAAADMWSWAVTIAFAGTGELPFKGESLTATAYAILHSEPAVGRLPEPLGSLVHRCLSKDPAARPSAREALSELVAAGAQLGGPAPADGLRSCHGRGDIQLRARACRAAGAAARHRRWPDRRRAGVQAAAGAARERSRLVARAGGCGAGRDLAGCRCRRRLHSPCPGAAHRQSGRRAAHAGTSPDTRRRGRGENAGRNLDTAPGQPGRGRVMRFPGVRGSAEREAFRPRTCGRSGPSRPIRSTLDLVVATADIRAQFGGRLASVYAPAVIASFGSGSARIDIRWVYPGGAAKYHAVQAGGATRQEDCRRPAAGERPASGSRPQPGHSSAAAMLIRGCRFSSPPWLITTRCSIVDFVSQSPGGGPGQPAAVGGPGRGGRGGAPHACGIPRLDAGVHRRAASPVPPRMEPAGHAAYRPGRAEDRVWRAEPALARRHRGLPAKHCGARRRRRSDHGMPAGQQCRCSRRPRPPPRGRQLPSWVTVRTPLDPGNRPNPEPF